MKISVYGDSYADANFHESRAGFESWVSLLKKTFETDCYGIAGSSLYYSYKKFVLTQSNYDKIIFIATIPGRLEIPDHIEVTHPQARFLGNYASVEHVLETRQDMPEEYKKCLEAAKQYFLYLYNKEKEFDYYELLIEKILEIRPDTILLNVVKRKQDVPRLVDISKRELKTAGYPDEAFHWIDKRPCHFSKRTNEFFHKKIVDWLNGEPIEIIIDDFPVILTDEIANLISKR